MSKSLKKIEAQEFRRRGESITAIAKKLGVSKGSVSIWCREIKLTQKQEKVIKNKMIKAGHKGRLMGAQVNKERKQNTIDKYEALGKFEFKGLTKRERYLIGLGLYWGEGVKTHNSATGFSNSDPQAILFMKKWFGECMGISNDRFIPRIYLNESHKVRNQEILKFWSNLLELPTSQFGNTVFIKIKNKKKYPNKDIYKGVMLLTVRRGSDLKYQILGLIKGLHQ